MPFGRVASARSFAKTLRRWLPDTGAGWCFGAIRTTKRRPNRKFGLGHIERRPAPIFFKSPGALLARIVQQPLRDVLPDRVLAIQADRIRGLDFYGTLAASAGDAQCVAVDLREMSLRSVKS